MRTIVFLSLLAGCATGPTSLQVETASLTVHTTETVALPAVRGLDAKGGPVELTTAPTWTVSPESVAKLSADGTHLELLGDGTATATATLGEVSTTFTVEVSLPDTLTVSAIPALEVGQSAPLSATVLADGTALDGQTITFASSDPAIATVTGDLLTAVAPGEIELTATSGALTQTLDVAIIAPAEAPVAAVE